MIGGPGIKQKAQMKYKSQRGADNLIKEDGCMKMVSNIKLGLHILMIQGTIYQNNLTIYQKTHHLRLE